MQRSYDLIVIGAGAAGLMCAGTAAARGVSVLLIDHAEKPGKKILISGGGRCNFTNRDVTAADYISHNPHFCKSALARFTPYDFIDMVEAAGIAYHERDHGQLFCDESAGEIVEMLLTPCRNHGVELRMQHSIESVQKSESGFDVTTSHGCFHAASLVIATGGLSIAKIGATGFGLKLAEQFGLPLRSTTAGLVPFTITGTEKDAFRSLAGISLDVAVSCRGQCFREAMLFTHRGLSGPAMLQISSYWQPGDAITIDLFPGVDTKNWLMERRAARPQAQLVSILAEHLPKRLARLLVAEQFDDQRMQQISDARIEQIAAVCSGWQIKPAATEGYRTAEITVGGVDTDALNSKTMACKSIPNLYFIGEVVDVTGHLGGFNFQWAWSSGYAAAEAITQQR